MRCLVTGTSGFVGLNVARMLASDGHDVLAIGRRPPDEWVQSFCADVSRRIDFRVADVSRFGALRGAVAGDDIDVVIHAAVITATTADVERESALEIVHVNVCGTMATLDLAREKGSQRFVYISSPSAIGRVESGGTIDEHVVPQPETIYGISKLASEHFVRRYGRMHGISTASVRIAQPYGPGERATPSRPRTSPIYEWLLAANRGETLVTGPLDVARDWTYVDDTARGIITLALAPELRSDLYHLSVGAMTTVGDVLDMFRRTFSGLAIDTRVDAEGLNPNIAGSTRRWPLDCSRFRSEFGWSPSTGIADGMATYLAWDARMGNPEG